MLMKSKLAARGVDGGDGEGGGGVVGAEVVAVDYLDRFLCGFELHGEKRPWVTQLAAVACLSLAAEVEETQVPLLLDLQVEDPKYVFEPKTIQRMEILVLSTLQWRMNPVTPLSFLEYIARSLKFKDHFRKEFLRRCECLLVSVISDCRFMCHLPSALATAIMVYVISSLEPCVLWTIKINYWSDDRLKGLKRIDTPVSPEEEAIHLGHTSSTLLAAGEYDPFRWDLVRVKLKKEIVTLGMPSVSPIERVGTYVSTKEWNELISDPDTVELIGSAKTAGQQVEETEKKMPRVEMYCTGGIRCEKASSFLLSKGFKELDHP
ncbi:Cyclin-D3-2 [Striga hermonthica]|uniref:Cyclin-D3-2 n=2 Tax=Striga hermonthica TaxID=68872 RepID=A0A9N7MRM7_STRHE|nr:Cyclin-D3-2 [Striga hermonthica]